MSNLHSTPWETKLGDPGHDPPPAISKQSGNNVGREKAPSMGKQLEKKTVKIEESNEEYTRRYTRGYYNHEPNSKP